MYKEARLCTRKPDCVQGSQIVYKEARLCKRKPDCVQGSQIVCVLLLVSLWWGWLLITYLYSYCKQFPILAVAFLVFCNLLASLSQIFTVSFIRTMCRAHFIRLLTTTSPLSSFIPLLSNIFLSAVLQLLRDAKFGPSNFIIISCSCAHTYLHVCKWHRWIFNVWLL